MRRRKNSHDQYMQITNNLVDCLEKKLRFNEACINITTIWLADKKIEPRTSFLTQKLSRS
jgi:hypothetical protein